MTHQQEAAKTRAMAETVRAVMLRHGSAFSLEAQLSWSGVVIAAEVLVMAIELPATVFAERKAG